MMGSNTVGSMVIRVWEIKEDMWWTRRRYKGWGLMNDPNKVTVHSNEGYKLDWRVYNIGEHNNIA